MAKYQATGLWKFLGCFAGKCWLRNELVMLRFTGEQLQSRLKEQIKKSTSSHSMQQLRNMPWSAFFHSHGMYSDINSQTKPRMLSTDGLEGRRPKVVVTCHKALQRSYDHFRQPARVSHHYSYRETCWTPELTAGFATMRMVM